MTTAPLTSPTSRLASLHAVGAMCTPIVYCPPETPLADVAALMAGQRIHCVATGGLTRDRVTGLRMVWGIVSDADIAAAALSGRDDLTASDIAGTEIVTVDPDTTLDVVVRHMLEHETAHVIVVADDEPVGVISTLDIAAAVAAG
jgi:CBS domain-containing protein